MFKVQKQYRHLNQFQRDALYQHCSAGIAVGKIADIIGVHKSTLYRELKRNRHPDHKHYLSDYAQKIALARVPRQGSKIERSKQLQQLIREGIAMSISPEVIAGRLKREAFDQKISHESIYKWIYERQDPPPLQIGHLEIDTIHLSKGSESILTIYDKVTKMVFGAKMKTRKTEETIDMIKLIMNKLPH